MAKRIVLLGAPGVGKGTLGQEVAKRLNIPYVSTGDMLRGAVAAKTELGRKIESILAAGQLVNDDLVTELIRERISKPDCEDGYMLDGYPRTIYQAESLELVPNGKVDLVFNVELPVEEIVLRISSRRSCPKCKAVYNTVFSPPKNGNICDRCGTALATRADDKPETVRDRIAVYEKNTKPLINYYKKKGILESIDSAGPDNEKKIRKMMGIIEK